MSTVRDRVLRRVDDMESEIIEQAAELIKVESVNPKYPGTVYDDVVGGEGTAARQVSEIWKAAGAEIDLFAVEPGRDNAVGIFKGSGRGRSLIMNGHVDTVPVGNASDWADGQPFSGRIDSERIWGRGAADQKCGVIAQAMAVAALAREGVRLHGDLIMEAVVGEEVMDHECGVSATIRRGYRADAAIVSEPTAPPGSLSVVPVSPGLFWFSVTVIGKASHASVRDEMIRAGGAGSAIAVNAIEKGIRIMAAIRDLEEEWGITKRHPLFKPGHFTIHPGVITGGPYGVLVPFIISQFCTIEYACWFPPDEDPETIKAEISTHVTRAAALDSWLRENPPRIDWKLHWPALNTPPTEPIVEAVSRAHREAVGSDAPIGGGQIAGFCAVCDAAFLSLAGIPSVVYGPGSILQAHTVDEWVSKADVVTAAKTFAIAAMEWCGASGGS